MKSETYDSMCRPGEEAVSSANITEPLLKSQAYSERFRGKGDTKRPKGSSFELLPTLRVGTCLYFDSSIFIFVIMPNPLHQIPTEPSVRSDNSFTSRLGSFAPFTNTFTSGLCTTILA
jgi:hypothetical protein